MFHSNLLRAVVLAVGAVAPASALAQRPSAEHLARAVDSLAAQIVALGITPGLGVAVVMDGRAILSRAYGLADATKHVPADDRTLWYVASTAKSFTGFGIALLAQRGTLSLDASMFALLPRARWAADVEPRLLTLGQMLSHTHHLDGTTLEITAAYTAAFPESRWPVLLQYAKPSGSTDLVYSNFGYNVAGMVLDAQRPEGWRRYLQRAVFAPAGMHETFTQLTPGMRSRIALPHQVHNGALSALPFLKTDVTMHAAGGEVSTLHDLARWLIVQLDSGVIDGRRVFPAEAIAISHRQLAPQTVPSARRFAYFDRDGWSAGWDIGRYEGERMVSRFGSFQSLRSHVSMLPGRRIGVVSMANGQAGSLATDIVAAYAYDLEAGRGNAFDVAKRRVDSLRAQQAAQARQIAASDSVRAARQQPMDRPLSAVTGRYHNDAFGTLALRMHGTTLEYQWGAASGPVEIFDAPSHRLRLELAGNGVSFKVEFDSAGTAQSLTLMNETFRRVR